MKERTIPDNSTKFEYLNGLVTVYTYTGNMSGKLIAMAYVGKSSKPAWHYSFKDEAARQYRIHELVKNVETREAAKAKRRAEAREVPEISKGDKFVACWGYDQTQYSIYEVVSTKGKSVIIKGMNSWAGLDAKDLCEGSQVKIFKYTAWDDLSNEERVDLTSRHFDRWNYNTWKSKEAAEAAEVRTIVKMNRVNGESYTYCWELDNGDIFDSTEDYKTRAQVAIVQAYTKKLVKGNGDYKPSIRIDSVITAYLDKDYSNNSEKYAEQNAYTDMNGR